MKTSETKSKEKQPTEEPGPLTDSLSHHIEKDLKRQESAASPEVPSVKEHRTGNYVRSSYKMARNNRSILLAILITALVTFLVTAYLFLGGIWAGSRYLVISSSQPLAKTDYTILGQFGDHIYSYNNSVSKVYAYTPALDEDEIISIPKAGQLSWHASGKLALISNAENRLGNIYIYDLSLTSPSDSKVIPTERENPPRFPANFQINATKQLVWSDDGNAIAFTAENVDTNREALFIYELSNAQLTQTPVKEFQRISSVVWITTTKTITSELVSLVGVTENQEKRIYITRAGTGYTEWSPPP